MFRAILPFILASLGITLGALATAMPLFEWQISEIVTDFPATYEVHIQPSPWTAKLGDSLSDPLYISLGRVYVSQDSRSCRPEALNFVVRRSQDDMSLEKMLLNFKEKSIPWLSLWGARVIFLSVIYIWWFTIWYKRPIWEAFISTLIVGVFYIVLSQIVRNILPNVVPIEYLGGLECDPGTLTFNAKLLNVHYEMLLVFFTGILLGLGAVGVMLSQIMKAIIERKESSKSAVG